MKETINYIKFADMFEKKKKEYLGNLSKNEKLKSSNKKLMLSTIGEDRRVDLISSNAQIDKNMNQVKDTMNHKSVAEIALKNEKKKHKQ